MNMRIGFRLLRENITITSYTVFTLSSNGSDVLHFTTKQTFSYTVGAEEVTGNECSAHK